MITQLNVTYVAEEDRVLFRFNTHDGQEFRLWLTRATVRQLLAVGAQASVLAHAAQHALPQAQAIAQFKQQSVEQQARFSDYKPAAQTPLGEAPLLRQCTFSIWRNTDAMDAYARSGAHSKAIAATYRNGFFSESMFVRMRVLFFEGIWEGKALDFGLDSQAHMAAA